MRIFSAIFLLLIVDFACGQKLVIGSKVPMFKGSGSVVWSPVVPSMDKEFWLVDFVSTFNPTSMRQYQENLPQIKTALGGRANIIVVGSADDLGFVELMERDSDMYYFLLDTRGDFARLFGVQFLPYSVVVDIKGRLLWQGNLGDLVVDDVLELE